MAIWGEVDLPAEAWSWHKMATIKTMGFSKNRFPNKKARCPFQSSVRLHHGWFGSSFLAGDHGVEGHRGHQHEIPDLAP